MRQLLLLLLFISVWAAPSFGQCTARFTTSISFEEATFLNQSVARHAHFYWNFGDGTSSRFESPIHRFPASGKYFVTLFLLDSAGDCNAYHDEWINIQKQDDPCQLAIDDSIVSEENIVYVTVLDRSSNCTDRKTILIDPPHAANLPYKWWSHFIWWERGRFVSRASFDFWDAPSENSVRYAYKSFPYHYSSAKNYGPCSADFEFNTVLENSKGKLIRFSAMNCHAAEYHWTITGFGDPITSDSASTLKFFRYSQYYPEGQFYTVYLTTIGQNGCGDTMVHSIFGGREYTRPSDFIRPQPFAVYPNPFRSQFIVEAPLTNGEVGAFSMFNTLGQLIISMDQIKTPQFTVRCPNLPSGIYYYRMSVGNSLVGSGKLVAY